MFERYTEKARRVIFFARYEAAQFGSKTIETEHFLLGLMREDRSLTRFLGPAQESGDQAILKAAAEAEGRVAALQLHIQSAILAHDFAKARALSDEELRERAYLSQLHKTHHAVGQPDEALYIWIRREIEQASPPGKKISTSADLPLSHQCKRALAYGAEESELLNRKHVAPEHLLLGLLREESCLAARILSQRGVKISNVREAARSFPPLDSSGPQEGRNYV